VKKIEANKLGQFVKIKDIKKCFVELNQNPDTDTLWPNQEIRNQACELEWKKYEYLPMNGQIGEIISIIKCMNLGEPILIIRTFGMFYIPISELGVEKIEVKQSIKS